MAYRVTSHDGETLTVEIDLPALLPQRFEIDARNEDPRLPEGAVGEEAAQLLAQGAVHIDISYSTPRIAASFPLKGLTWNEWLEGKTVDHLYRIRRLFDR